MAKHTSANATVAAHHAAGLTTSNSTSFNTTRAVFVGVAGDLEVSMESGAILTFKNVPVGVFPIQITQLRTGTTASEVIALY